MRIGGDVEARGCGRLLVVGAIAIGLLAGCNEEPVGSKREQAERPHRSDRPAKRKAAQRQRAKRRAVAQRRQERKQKRSRVPSIPRDAKRDSVAEVIDGDTVELAGLGRARVIGVDTPEVHFRTECYGAEASAFAKSLLKPGATVFYKYDVERRDRYDRHLVYLWLSSGTFFNAALVKEGYAVPLTIPPNVEYADLFRELAASARRAERGLWDESTCAGDADAPVGGSKPKPAKSAAAPPPAPAGNCEPGYSPCVPSYPPDLDCADVNGPIQVTGSDPHRLDGDGDGVGCET